MNGLNIGLDVSVVNMQSGPQDAAPSRRAAYHHGALRDALLDGARTMLAERGPEGFSLSELARRVGVSTAAPYRHFADRDALFDELGDEGYRLFGRRLTDAVAAASDTADDVLRIGVAYLTFAAEHPATFQIMFQDRAGRPAVEGPPTFATLVGTIERAQADGALPADQPPHVLSRTVWATLHGLAVLDARGGLTKLGLGDTRERLVADAFAPYLVRPRTPAPS